MLQEFWADFHIHSCLSPCGELDSSPKRIVLSAMQKGLNIIAVCDHNSVENVPYVMNAAKDSGIVVVPGMEAATKEEVHIVALFGSLEAAFEMQKIVYENLPGKNSPEVFGMQVVANENDEVEGFCEKLLIGATNLNIYQIVEEVHALDGLAIAAHVDRQAFSIIGQLGFIPPDLELDGIELSYRVSPPDFLKEHPELSKYSIIRGSDAHHPDDIGRAFTKVFVEHRTFEELKLAFKRVGGRRIEF